MSLITNNISGSSANSSRIGVTGSVIVSNTSAPFPDFPGADVVFFVSGSIDSADKSSFGGDLVVSGTLSGTHGAYISGTVVMVSDAVQLTGSLLVSGTVDVSGPVSASSAVFSADSVEVTGSLSVSGSTYFNGSLVVTNGISGSLQTLSDGSTPYLIAGPNITITTQSNGSVAISGSSGGSNTQVQFNDNGALGGDPNFIFNKTSSALFLSGTFLLNTSSAAYYENFSVNQVVTSSGATSLQKMGAFFNQVLTGSETDSSILYGLVSYSTNKSDLPYGMMGFQSVANHQSTSSISSVWGWNGGTVALKPDDGSTAGNINDATALYAGCGFDIVENFSGSITNLQGFKYNNYGINAARTVTNSYGVRLLNVGAAQGVTNAIGVEVESINTASGIKLGVRTQDPIVIGTTNVTGSEKLRVNGESYFDGAAKFPGGLSGSLTSLVDGSPYLVAGPNITINTGSTGQVAISASLAYSAIVTASSNYSVNAADQIVLFTVGNITATLPAGVAVGSQYIFKDKSASASSAPQMISSSLGTIDGASTYTLPAINYGSVQVVKVGSSPDEWIIL